MKAKTDKAPQIDKPRWNRSTIIKRSLDAVLVLALIYAALLAFGFVRRGSNFEEGTKAPDITVRALDSGKPVSLKDSAGKPTLLVFFSVSCPACRRELPDVQEMMERAGEKLNVLVVSADSPQELKSYWTKEGLKLPVGVDGGAAHRAYQVSTIPYSVVIDGEGKVRADFVGGVRWADLESLL